MNTCPPAHPARLVILGTGGTIAGTADSSASTNTYTAATLGLDALLQGLPDLTAQARLQGEQLLRLDSKDMQHDDLLRLARRTAELAARDDVDGIVITHGTDTLEESAYLLHLAVPTAKPIVLTGAMRPATALSADGPLNLHDAILTAAAPSSRGLGALVVMNGEIHSARDLAKKHATHPNAFASPYGPLGLVIQGDARFYRRPARRHTIDSAFPIDRLSQLPRVDILLGYGGADASACDAIETGMVRGVVYAGPGNASIPAAVLPGLERLQRAGVVVARASATGCGGIVPDDSLPGAIAVDDQSPLKARLLLSLGLACGLSGDALAALFTQY